MSESSNTKRPLYIPIAGPSLLETPLLNKGSAFSEQERTDFNIRGLVPQTIETIEEQAARCYQQLKAFDRDIDKHIYIRNIQDANETLFYKVVNNHIEEIMPIIYTPTVGKACEKFSQIYRRKRGLFVSYPDRHNIDDILQNATKQNVKIIVVTDGERILGLGDQGIGGMGIPIGKLSLYTACGGISPAYTLPVVLDVGCNNSKLLEDPLYMGWRHERISGDEYYEFVETFVQALLKRWPEALLQFEDFAATNASPLLEKYRDRLCSFNDDIQGTAAVTVGTLLAASKNRGESLKDQRVMFLGAGSAGCGIAQQVIAQMKREGLSDKEARDRVLLVDKEGLVVASVDYLMPFQKSVACDDEAVSAWPKNKNGRVEFLDAVHAAKPTVLIGVSGQAGAFTEDAIKAMQEYTEHPIVLPLSNPTSKSEATPADILKWTNGKAIVATGSPFEPVVLDGKTYKISQCNNSYIFPGVGLGILASKANRVTNNMLMASSEALAKCAYVKPLDGSLLPPLSNIRDVSKSIAKVVGLQAMEDGVAPKVTEVDLEKSIAKNFWEPKYRNYRRRSYL